MKIVMLHNSIDKSLFKKVKAEMLTLGQPTIRAYDLGFDGLYQAIEGTHRLVACAELGICPKIELVNAESLIKDLELDVDYLNDDDTIETLGDWENDRLEISDNSVVLVRK